MSELSKTPEIWFTDKKSSSWLGVQMVGHYIFLVTILTQILESSLEYV